MNGIAVSLEFGKYSESEASLTEPLLGRLEPGMVLLADRGFFSYALWRRAIATGADLLWRARTDRCGPTLIHLDCSASALIHRPAFGPAS